MILTHFFFNDLVLQMVSGSLQLKTEMLGMSCAQILLKIDSSNFCNFLVGYEMAIGHRLARGPPFAIPSLL